MAGNSFSIYCLSFGSSLLGKQLNRYCLPWGTCVSVHPWLAASGSSPTWFPIEGICLQSYDKLRVLTSILRIQKNAKSSTTLTTGQDSLNLTELECVKQGWQPLWIGLKKNESQTHPRKRNRTNKFPDDCREGSTPSLRETPRSLPSCWSKEAWTVLDSFPVLANVSLEWSPVPDEISWSCQLLLGFEQL